MSTEDPLGAGRMCPHCNRPLPDEATFCNECGRRVEGWQGNVKASAADGTLPESDVDTREMQVTPEMLRAAGKKAAAPSGVASAKRAASSSSSSSSSSSASSKTPSPTGESDSQMIRGFSNPRLGTIAIVGMALAAAVLVFLIVRKKHVETAPPTENPPVTPPPAGTPITPPTKTKSGKRTPKKLAPEAIDKGVADAPSGPAPVVDGTKAGALPKKTTPTDSASKPADKPKTTGTTPKPQLPNEDLPNEAAPMTDDELRQQEEARLNADQVRYVVKQHLSQVRACYERQFKQEAPGGRVEVSFAIGEDGKARRVRTDVNTTGSEPFARCIEGLVGNWTFPKPIGGEFELTYPFVFSSGG